jgi:hypothetical protein
MSGALTGHVNVGRTFPLFITGNTTLAANEFNRVIAIPTGPITLILPALAACPNGYEILIRNNSAGANTVTVQGNGSELIGASNTAAVTQNTSLRILVDHVRTKWQILFGPA